MTDNDKRENDERGVTRATRRDILMGGAASAVGLAGLTMATSDAQAQSGDERLILGPEWWVDDNSDQLDLGYGGSGAGTVDYQGQKAANLGALDTDEETVNDTATDPTVNGQLRRNGVDLKAYSGGAVRNLSNIGGGSTYSDEEAQDAVGTILSSQFTYDDATPAITLDQGEGSGLNADSWEGYDLQKNGTDGTGVINFKT